MTVDELKQLLSGGNCESVKSLRETVAHLSTENKRLEHELLQAREQLKALRDLVVIRF